ncbi:phenylalanine--tRNA ligase subunit beta [Candidatus Kuenenbacteria bacterium]|nr:phenylalanine--tRNA ligase subunit beta [Candidatus Kuenenbacteria bacterium]
MLVSLNLLKRYVDLPATATPEEVVAKLSACTVEVEDFFEAGKDLKNIVVCKVVKLEKHPNADKLRIVRVDMGKDSLLKVVCGGINLYEGMLTAVALPGAMVKWHGEGESVKLERTKIRGEESEGMICAANEIGLADRFPAGELEIIDLTVLDFQIGKSLAEAFELDDVIIDIDNKSITNRPDLWGHYGIAREVAAIYDSKLKPLEIEEKAETREAKDKDGSGLKVSIKDYKLCPRYLGLMVENVKVKESPLWLRNALTLVGLRPINNIVDVTNYVMVEIGQPMHAFDAEVVGNIVVRVANQGEKIITLDKVEMELDPETLVIADSKKPIAVAGVMGGLHSQITDKTKKIILEAANFEAVGVRKTSQRLGVRTDASMRFEKSLDVNLAEAAIRRASYLIKEIIPEAKVAETIVADGKVATSEETIEMSVGYIQTKTGVEISKGEIVDILKRLGFVVKDKKENLAVTVPSWRATGDIKTKEDLSEEVARIYGYEKIKPEFPEVRIKTLPREGERIVINKIKDQLSGRAAMNEILNYSFWPKKLVDDLGVEREAELIGLLNPLSEDQAYLRMSLVPGLLKNISDNSRFYDEFKLYEVGRIFLDRKGKYKIEKHSKEHLPDQPYYLAGALVGPANKEPFWEAKGIIEGLGEEFDLDFVAWSAGRNPFYEFINKMTDKEKRLVIVNGKEKIGWIGEVNVSTADYFGVKNRKIAVFELDLTAILEAKEELKQYRPAPKYPVVWRDIAIEVAWKTHWENIKKEIAKINPLIKEITFLSEYDLGKKKSLAWRVKYQSEERTLKDEEVAALEAEVVGMLESKFGAKRR